MRTLVPHSLQRCLGSVPWLLAAVLAGCAPVDDGPDGGATSSSGSSGTSSGSSSGGTSSSSSSSGGGCQPVTCEMACRYGFASGPDGCLECRCLPDPRPCASLTRDECGGSDHCIVVDYAAGGGSSPGGGAPAPASWTCCERAADGTVRCGEPAPPPTCQSDSECGTGQVCNTWDYCELSADPAPGCGEGGMGCPAVCLGRCVASGGGGCASDWDCAETEWCRFSDTATPCPQDPNSGACDQRFTGTCEIVECPAMAMICPDGSYPAAVQQVPHGCPIPICTGTPCEQLDPAQCQLRADCLPVYDGGCACSCPAGGECPPCDCAPAQFLCSSRPGCFSDGECAPGEFCDFTYDTCGPTCDRPPMGVCVPRQTLCEGLDEPACQATRGCQPLYGDICPACPVDPTGGGDCPPCQPAYLGCTSVNVAYCSRDLDCGPGFRCNLCPPDPNCPNCGVCGAPVCEPSPVTHCTQDAECGPARHCRIEVCTDGIPPSCVGTCEDGGVECTGLDEQRCGATSGCRPTYEATDCQDGCHDPNGRVISCGPCLDIACERRPFQACEAAPVEACCNDGECPLGQLCVFNRDINLGECLPNPAACGGAAFGSCPAGSTCEVVGCAPDCGVAGGGTRGGSEPSPGCCPAYQCVPVRGCQADTDCGPGMTCNACPSACPPGAETCPALCGEPRCESIPATSCRTDADCPGGCSCKAADPAGVPGSSQCLDVNGTVCTGRPFRACTSDAECLPDEYCQRCPPGSACFVVDHCAPRDRPVRSCTLDQECLPDEHCGTVECTPGSTCPALMQCLPGAPALRVCGADSECRPDEYCWKCPSTAMCDVADHCEPRPFRPCQTSSECLPDEYCEVCPVGSACLVPDHCVQSALRFCETDAQCAPGEHCEHCPPGAQCLVADHCARN